MIVETMLDSSPPWCDSQSDDAAIALWSQVSLVRNLSDFPFPRRCSTEEKRSVEQRVLEALESSNLLAAGRYYPLDGIEPRDARFLAERGLVTCSLLRGEGPRGVYISEDQALSVMVNGVNHVCVRVLLGGQKLEEAWNRATVLDDTLSNHLDYAFNERLGYLSPALDRVGTGLKASLLLHLPCLGRNQFPADQAALASRSSLSLGAVRLGIEHAKVAPLEGEANQEILAGIDQGLYGELDGVFNVVPGGRDALSTPRALGGLFVLGNSAALGISEEELLFRLRHTYQEISSAERQSRDKALGAGRTALEDQCGRALGVAGHAHLAAFPEALDWLSAIRMGTDLGLLRGFDMTTLNTTLLRIQGAHIEATSGIDSDPLAVNAARATLLRGQFS